jgi:hypothetical protein
VRRGVVDPFRDEGPGAQFRIEAATGPDASRHHDRPGGVGHRAGGLHEPIRFSDRTTEPFKQRGRLGIGASLAKVDLEILRGRRGRRNRLVCVSLFLAGLIFLGRLLW